MEIRKPRMSFCSFSFVGLSVVYMLLSACMTGADDALTRRCNAWKVFEEPHHSIGVGETKGNTREEYLNCSVLSNCDGLNCTWKISANDSRLPHGSIRETHTVGFRLWDPCLRQNQIMPFSSDLVSHEPFVEEGLGFTRHTLRFSLPGASVKLPSPIFNGQWDMSQVPLFLQFIVVQHPPFEHDFVWAGSVDNVNVSIELAAQCNDTSVHCDWVKQVMKGTVPSPPCPNHTLPSQSKPCRLGVPHECDAAPNMVCTPTSAVDTSSGRQADHFRTRPFLGSNTGVCTCAPHFLPSTSSPGCVSKFPPVPPPLTSTTTSTSAPPSIPTPGYFLPNTTPTPHFLPTIPRRSTLHWWTPRTPTTPQTPATTTVGNKPKKMDTTGSITLRPPASQKSDSSSRPGSSRGGVAEAVMHILLTLTMLAFVGGTLFVALAWHSGGVAPALRSIRHHVVSPVWDWARRRNNRFEACSGQEMYEGQLSSGTVPLVDSLETNDHPQPPGV